MIFKDWLSGYLEGKESLNKKDIELIQEKMAISFEPYNPPYPVFIPYKQPYKTPSIFDTVITCGGTTATGFTYTHQN